MPASTELSPRTTSGPDPATAKSAAIEAVDLKKTYGKGDKAVRALVGIGFSVPAGRVRAARPQRGRKVDYREDSHAP